KLGHHLKHVAKMLRTGARDNRSAMCANFHQSACSEHSDSLAYWRTRHVETPGQSCFVKRSAGGKSPAEDFVRKLQAQLFGARAPGQGIRCSLGDIHHAHDMCSHSISTKLGTSCGLISIYAVPSSPIGLAAATMPICSSA